MADEPVTYPGGLVFFQYQARRAVWTVPTARYIKIGEEWLIGEITPINIVEAFGFIFYSIFHEGIIPCRRQDMKTPNIGAT